MHAPYVLGLMELVVVMFPPQGVLQLMPWRVWRDSQKKKISTIVNMNPADSALHDLGRTKTQHLQHRVETASTSSGILLAQMQVVSVRRSRS